MTLQPNAHATGRRNLAQRIDRFLRAQEALPSPTLTGWQGDQVLAAIELLESEQFSDGEHIMLRAEKPLIFEPARYVAVDRKDVGQLLKLLERVLAA